MSYPSSWFGSQRTPFEFYERTLVASEISKVANLPAQLTPTPTSQSGSVFKEKFEGRFFGSYRDDEESYVEIAVGEAGRAFVAFHAKKSYDERKRLFVGREDIAFIRDLIRQPGARKKAEREFILSAMPKVPAKK